MTDLAMDMGKSSGTPKRDEKRGKERDERILQPGSLKRGSKSGHNFSAQLATSNSKGKKKKKRKGGHFFFL